jgi:Caspase domain
LVSTLGVHSSMMLGANATGSRIQSKIRQLARLTKSGETLVVYFAGHGAPTPNAQPEALLVPYDTDPSDLLGTALALRDLQAVKTDGGRVVFVLDSCFSGQAGSRSITQENTRPFGVVAKVSSGAGVTTFTATSNSDPSLESAQLGGGVFTYFLLEGLRGAADSNKDGRVTLEEAHAYALSKVRAEARKQSLNQTPELSGDSSFALGVNGDRDRAVGVDKRLEPLVQLKNERKFSVQQYLFLEESVRSRTEPDELKLFLDGKITAAQFLRLLPTIPGIPK